MTFRAFSRGLLAAAAVSALVGAGQLGLAYGLGIVRLARAFDAAARNQWSAQLTWVAWSAMVAAVLGAVVAERLARRYGFRPSAAGNAALAGAAALGAALVAPLSMQPARDAQVPSADPVLAAGLTAMLGAVVGLAAALAALSLRPVRWNIAALTAGVWFLALLSVMPSLGPDDPLPSVRLGVLDSPWLSTGSAQRLAVITMPALALVLGALSGALARWRGLPMLPVATAGVVAPAMLALAYMIAGPGDAGGKYQAAPYWGAIIALAAGALGSVLAAVARWPLTAGLTTSPGTDTGSDDTARSTSTSPASIPVADPVPPARPAAIPQQRAVYEDSIDVAEQQPTAPYSAANLSRRPTTEDFWPSEATPTASPEQPGERSDDVWDAFAAAERSIGHAWVPGPDDEPPAGQRPVDATQPDEPPAGQRPVDATQPDEPPAGQRPVEATEPEQVPTAQPDRDPTADAEEHRPAEQPRLSWTPDHGLFSDPTPSSHDPGQTRNPQSIHNPTPGTDQHRPEEQSRLSWTPDHGLFSDPTPSSPDADQATTPRHQPENPPRLTWSGGPATGDGPAWIGVGQPDVTPFAVRDEAGTGRASAPNAGPDAAAVAGPDIVPVPEADAADEAQEETESGKTRPRRGLFRRNRSPEARDRKSAGSPPSDAERGRNRADDQVPARDEEYVDWVSGLSDPDPADDLGESGTRRSLRPPGRHQAE